MRDGAHAFELVHRPALAAAARTSGLIRIAALAESTVLQVFADPARRASLSALADTNGMSLRPNGPGQWFLVAESHVARDSVVALGTALPKDCAVTDLSHGRVRIAIEGAAVEHVLAKGTGIDLDRYEVGAASTTLIGYITVHLTRLAPDRFELLVMRTFAESLWDDLGRMAGEFLEGGHV